MAKQRAAKLIKVLARKEKESGEEERKGERKIKTH